MVLSSLKKLTSSTPRGCAPTFLTIVLMTLSPPTAVLLTTLTFLRCEPLPPVRASPILLRNFQMLAWISYFDSSIFGISQYQILNQIFVLITASGQCQGVTIVQRLHFQGYLHYLVFFDNTCQLTYHIAMMFVFTLIISINIIRKMAASGFNTSFGATNQYALLNSSLGSDRKSQPEHKKILCAYHSTQFLTNFCIDKECLMPLCPTCVVEHTQEHYQCNQKPTYVNLNDALQESKQKCYSNIIKLEEFNRKNVQLSNYIQGLPDYIRKQLSECKEKLYTFIDQKFQAFENSLIQEIRNKYQEDGVYNRKECEEVREFIGTEIQNLYEKITQLKGDQCLSALIRYYQCDEKNLQNEMNQIVDYIDKNKRAGGIYITLNTEQLTKDFSSICERLVTLQYIHHDQSKSFSSNKNIDQQSSNKKGISNSIVSKTGPKSNIKDKSGNKLLANSQSFSSKQEKGFYPSPFKNSPNF